MKISLFYPVLCVVALSLLVGCAPDTHMAKIAYDQQLKEEYVSKQCETKSMVGSQEGVQALIDWKRDELKSISGSIKIERYQKLYQELNGYSVKWEFANKETERACRAYAACRYRYDESPNRCVVLRDDYYKTRDNLLSFIKEITAMEIK